MKKIIFPLITFLSFSHAQAALTLVESSTNVGPGTTISVSTNTIFFDTIVDNDNISFRVNEAFPSSPPSRLNAAFASFGEDRIFFRESEAPNVPDPFQTRPDTAPTDSTIFLAITDAQFYQLVRLSNTGATSGFRNGAQAGDDNWVYFSNNNNPGTESPSFWTQFNITETSATPIRYVHDPVDPFGDITLADAVAVPEPSTVFLFCITSLSMFFRRRR
jgi:hypothetical protein